MGYEAEVPSIPTREQEKEMIKKIQKSFSDQPWYKFYMNEGLRLRKIELGKDLNTYSVSFYSNFFRGALASSLLFLPIAFLYRKTGNGVPMFFKPKNYFNMIKLGNINNFRNLKMIRFYLLSTLLGGTVYACSRTSMEPIFDEFYDNKSIVLPK